MRIRKSFDVVEVTPHPLSCDKQNEYRKKRDIDDNSYYVKVSEFSITEYVNSFKNGCSLKSILERSSLLPARDLTALVNNNGQGFEVDLSDYPTDLTDAYMRFNDLKANHPELIKRLNTGESLSTIVSDIMKSETNSNKEKEINTDGETK